MAYVELALDDALDVDLVGDQFHIGADFARELDLAGAQGAACLPGAAAGQVETDQLPHGVQPQASRHDRVALEMAGKKPQVGLDVELGHDLPRPCAPPSLSMWVMRSNISMGGRAGARSG